MTLDKKQEFLSLIQFSYLLLTEGFDSLGLSLENFVPLLDYKERAQQWRWIGQGRDTDEELASLYAYWAEHRETDQLDSGFDKMASVPPPRMYINF